MNVPLNKRELTGIEYPGTVVNTKNMMKQFGGENKVNDIFRDSTKRMELKFRPADPYSKPAYGDKFPTTVIVLEVVRKRKKRKCLSSVEASESFNINCLGIVKTIYKFKAMCDFQILPVDYSSGKVESLLPRLIPNDLHSSSWLDVDTPLFIMPMLFSRFDTPVNIYTDGVKVPRKIVQKESDSSLIETSRRKRGCSAIYINFESQESIEKPRQESLNMLQLYPQCAEHQAMIKKLYDERPIWSKSALAEILNCDTQRLRYILSAIAYSFNSGPWRKLWIKFGYDPRVNPQAKIYQLLDIRIRQNIVMKDLDPHRTKAFDYYIHPSKCVKSTAKTLIKTDHLLPSTSTHMEDKKSEELKTASYKFMPGHMPPARQCYYQFCDVYQDEVQQLVHQNDGQEQFCHEKDGWCDIGVLDKCREILYIEIQKLSLEEKTKE